MVGFSLWSYTIVLFGGLAELVGDAKTAAGQDPTDIGVGAPYTAAAAFNAALIGHLDLAITAQRVNAYRAEIEARLVLTACADFVLFDPNVRLFFIDEVLERYQQIIYIDVGKGFLELIRDLLGFERIPCFHSHCVTIPLLRVPSRSYLRLL